MTHYYAYGKDLLYSEIIIPDYAPRDYLDLTTLLSAIENAEKRYDARTGRTVRLTIPNDREFSDKERIDLTRSFVKNAFVSLGMCAIMALHVGENGNPAWNNPHAHVLLTDRPVDSNGFCSKKNRNWNTVEQLNKWRAAWAEAQNRAFKEKGLEMRVSHESLEVQGIDREPTRPLSGRVYRLRLVTGTVRLRPELKKKRKICASGDKREGSVGMTEEGEM